MANPDWSEISRHFFEHARRLGMTGSRLLLLLLAFVAMGGMVLGVDPIAAMALLIVAYILEPIQSCLKHHLDRTKSVKDLTASRDRLRTETRAIRHRQRLDEPELPLSVDQDEEGTVK
ncbi:MAG: hypothetical protein P0Y66_22050 [Candidatus Kaistia colombiensis]|nr:MAG: hypothetical protein P0Y66_22050 [Kaistia sp.]